MQIVINILLCLSIVVLALALKKSMDEVLDMHRKFEDEITDRITELRTQWGVVQANEYLNTAVKVTESFTDVNVDICEDGTMYIEDAKEGEQLAVFHIKGKDE